MGTTGNDVIDGGAGPDTISGGLGNDTYIVNDATDKIVEVSGGGTDAVWTKLSSYTLPYQVENLNLYGTSAQTGIGNDSNNLMVDNGVKSVLNGMTGNDTLVSTGGADTFTGGAGKDVFRFDKVPTNGPSTITDFAHQDQINLHGALQNYHGTNPIADHWMTITSDATGTTIAIDPDGPGGASGFVTVAKLTGFHSGLTMGTDWVF